MEAPRRKEVAREPTETRAHPVIALAHQRLDELAGDCQRKRFFGTIGIEISFEAGQPLLVRHAVNGVDKIK